MGKRRVAHDEPGFIYFITSCSGPVKIGFGTRPRARLANMQVGNCDQLFLAATVAGTLQDEADYHERFADRRIRGEWFDYCPAIMAEIDRLTPTEDW